MDSRSAAQGRYSATMKVNPTSVGRHGPSAAKADELAEMWNRSTPAQRTEAFLRAVLAFAQYAEESDDPSDEAVLGFAMGFLMDAQIPSKVQRLDHFLREYGVTISG